MNRSQQINISTSFGNGENVDIYSGVCNIVQINENIFELNRNKEIRIKHMAQCCTFCQMLWCRNVTVNF